MPFPGQQPHHGLRRSRTAFHVDLLKRSGVAVLRCGCENLSQAAEPLILEKDGFRIGVLALCEIVEERRGDLYAEAESSGAAPLIAGETLRARKSGI
jgi:hypothetical protein